MQQLQVWDLLLDHFIQCDRNDTDLHLHPNIINLGMSFRHFRNKLAFAHADFDV